MLARRERKIFWLLHRILVNELTNSSHDRSHVLHWQFADGFEFLVLIAAFAFVERHKRLAITEEVPVHNHALKCGNHGHAGTLLRLSISTDRGLLDSNLLHVLGGHFAFNR